MICVGLCIAQLAISAELKTNVSPKWLPIDQDELHDPNIAAAGQLHNPKDILSKLPREGSGNLVNWVVALEKGFIRPYTNAKNDGKSEVIDLNVLRKNTADMDMVLFQHRQHTEWLACDNCHEQIFKSKAGTTKFGMLEILNGEYCGLCHGAVAFPMTECNRCHNVPRTKDAQ